MSSRTFASTGRVLAAAVAALTAMLLWSTGPASAQQGAVTGQVVDASNLQPVVGAQVFFPELDRGTLTNEEGRFRITGVPAGQHQIRVRLLGYRPATQRVSIEAGQTATMDFQLSVSAVSLGEIVVTQTGEQEARELGRAVSTINAGEEVQKSKAGTIQDLIKGRSTGTTVRAASGSVGTGANFQIRGNATLSLDATPLIYVDGVLVSNTDQNLIGGGGNFFTGGQETSRLNDLNPEDIESIQVLKGPSATTLYGSNAASGVLVIETKRGRAGDARWTGRAQVGGNWDSTDWPGAAFQPQTAPVLAVGAFAKDTVYLMNLLEGKTAGIAPPWKTGFEQNYGGSVRGGFAEGDVSYYISGEYEELQGNLPSNRSTKWNARANFDLSPSEKVDVQVSSGFSSNATLLPQNDNNSFGFIGQALLGFPSLDKFDRRDPQGIDSGLVRTCPFAFEFARLDQATQEALFGASGLRTLSAAFCELVSPAPFFGVNFQDAALTRTLDDTERFTGSSTVTYRPWDFLTSRVTVGYDEFDFRGRQITPVVPRLTSFSSAFEGELGQEKRRGTNLSINATSTAAFDITDQVASTTTAGVQWFDETQESLFAFCREFPAGSPACDNSVDLQKTGTNDFFLETRTLGLFAEQQFAWRNSMFLTAGARIDENSAFGEELGAEVYPNVSYSWVMSDEEWFPELFETFKLRGAWGQSGEQPGTNAAFALLNANPTPFGGTRLIGVSPQQPSSAELAPARVTEVEAGFDMSLLDGRLSGEFTWYRQTTEDDIVQRPLAPSSGFPGSRFDNVAELENTGIETAVTATAFSLPDLTWDWRVQVSTNYNEITRLDNPIDVGFQQRHAEGRAFGAYYSPAVFFGEASDVEGSVPVSGVPGAFFTQNAVFEAPGLVSGDPTPNVNGSLSSTVTLFNHVTLYALAEFATGHQLGNNTEEFMCDFLGECAANFETSPEGERTDTAILKDNASELEAELNFIEDADYVKIRTVSVRFDLPDAWTSFMSGRDVSFQVTGENLAQWTGYTIDPEQTVGGQTQAFFSDFLTLPPAKRVSASVQVSF